MNDLIFVSTCALGVSIDAALFTVLLRRTFANPVLRHGRRTIDIAVSPFVVSSDPQASHLLVPGDGRSTVLAHLSLGEDRRWRITNLGDAQIELNGRSLSGTLRLFDGNEILVGSTLLRFRDAHSAPTRPIFQGYRLYGRPFSGGSSLVYPAKEAASGRRALLKVHDASRFVGDGITLNSRVEAEFRFLRRAIEGTGAVVGGRFPEPYALLTDDAGNRAIAMEHVRGVPLHRAIESGRPPRLSDVVLFGHALAQALERLAEMGIVHCDLKPANIVLRQRRWDAPCLVDFGVAVSTGELRAGGTEGFRSPEHGTAPMGPWSDVYAMGTLLQACLEVATDSDAGLRRRLAELAAEMRHASPSHRPTAKAIRERLEPMRTG